MEQSLFLFLSLSPCATLLIAVRRAVHILLLCVCLCAKGRERRKRRRKWGERGRKLRDFFCKGQKTALPLVVVRTLFKVGFCDECENTTHEKERERERKGFFSSSFFATRC